MQIQGNLLSVAGGFLS